MNYIDTCIELNKYPSRRDIRKQWHDHLMSHAHQYFNKLHHHVKMVTMDSDIEYLYFHCHKTQDRINITKYAIGANRREILDKWSMICDEYITLERPMVLSCVFNHYLVE